MHAVPCRLRDTPLHANVCLRAWNARPCMHGVCVGTRPRRGHHGCKSTPHRCARMHGQQRSSLPCNCCSAKWSVCARPCISCVDKQQHIDDTRATCVLEHQDCMSTCQARVSRGRGPSGGCCSPAGSRPRGASCSTRMSSLSTCRTGDPCTADWYHPSVRVSDSCSPFTTNAFVRAVAKAPILDSYPLLGGGAPQWWVFGRLYNI